MDTAAHIPEDNTSRPAAAASAGIWRHPVVGCLIGAAIYFCVAKLSLSLASAHVNTSAVWPASGLAIGGLLLFGVRFWPAVAIGVLALTLTVEPFSAGKSIMIAMGNTLEAVVGATLINRYADGRRCLRYTPTVCRFILLAAVLAPLLSAGSAIAAISIFDGVAPAKLIEVFATWYTGNMAGVLVFAPLVILWSVPRSHWSREKRIEGLILLAVLILVGQTICGFFITDWPSAYLVIPVLLWAALRLGRRGTVAALIVLTLIAVVGTVRGFEVFSGTTQNLSLLYLQIFLCVVSMMSLVVAGLVSELRLANESLENKVASRTRKLEEVVREKDDLMAIAAHDLQAPLAGMRNLLQLVQSQPKMLSGSDSGQVLQEMENVTDNMLALVSSLLVAKRAEELGMHLTVAPCDAVRLVNNTIGIHRPMAESKQIHINLEAPEQLEMSTHPESLSQIASNLLSNAVKYSPEGSKIDIHLEVTSVERKIRLEVRDQGPGIVPSELDSVFEKFHRSSNRPTNGESSHGIGLYIVDKLCKALGGTVSYAEADGGGSSFTVSLPCRS
ncbi:MAG: MASE1 domain-containing protein [Verrucomicrobiales bacterium]